MLNPAIDYSWELLEIPADLQEALARIHPLAWILTIIHWFQWQSELKALERKGVKICPLMTVEPLRFPAAVCRCDIPETRVIFLERHPQVSCHHGTHCLVTVSRQRPAHEEISPVALRKKRPRGSWTAAF